jgi:hypothetical protein
MQGHKAKGIAGLGDYGKLTCDGDSFWTPYIRPWQPDAAGACVAARRRSDGGRSGPGGAVGILYGRPLSCHPNVAGGRAD